MSPKRDLQLATERLASLARSNGVCAFEARIEGLRAQTYSRAIETFRLDPVDAAKAAEIVVRVAEDARK